MNKHKLKGFTIVELLIVIVVIGILAAIVIVAYNGIQARAQQSAITSEAEQWAKLFEAYKALNGSYPSPSATPLTGGGPGTSAKDRYCLGTGFPQVDGVNTCYSQVSGSGLYNVSESTGTSLMAQLATVGKPPTNTTKYIYGRVIGPHLHYISATEMRIVTTYAAGTVCPSGMFSEYSDATRSDCYTQLLSN